MLKLRDLFRRRKAERSAAMVNDIRQAAHVVALQESGIDADMDPDVLLDVLESEGMSIADFEANVELARKRILWAKDALELDDRKAMVDRLEKAAADFGRTEAERHRKALEKLHAMQLEIRAAAARYVQATAALSELQATAEPAATASELNAELRSVNAEINRLREKLDPKGPPARSGALLGSTQHLPALLLRQTREALADDRVGYTGERRQQLHRQLAVAQAAVTACEKNLARLEKLRDQLNQALTVGRDALIPENFRVIRRTMSSDERAKLEARSNGFVDTPAVRSVL